MFPVEICIEREKMYMVRANMQRQLKEDLNGICVDSIKGILRDWLTYDKVIPTWNPVRAVSQCERRARVRLQLFDTVPSTICEQFFSPTLSFRSPSIRVSVFFSLISFLVADFIFIFLFDIQPWSPLWLCSHTYSYHGLYWVYCHIRLCSVHTERYVL